MSTAIVCFPIDDDVRPSLPVHYTRRIVYAIYRENYDIKHNRASELTYAAIPEHHRADIPLVPLDQLAGEQDDVSVADSLGSDSDDSRNWIPC